jgi:hypothetical protein
LQRIEDEHPRGDAIRERLTDEQTPVYTALVAVISEEIATPDAKGGA